MTLALSFIMNRLRLFLSLKFVEVPPNGLLGVATVLWSLNVVADISDLLSFLEKLSLSLRY